MAEASVEVETVAVSLFELGEAMVASFGDLGESEAGLSGLDEVSMVREARSMLGAGGWRSEDEWGRETCAMGGADLAPSDEDL